MSSDAADASEKVDALIASLYSSGLTVPADQFRPWALRELAQFAGCDGALLGSGSVAQLRFHTVTVHGLPAGFPQQLEATTAINPLIPRLMQNLDTPIEMADVVDDQTFFGSELYQRVFAPLGITRILSTAHLNPRSGLYSLLTLYRRDRAHGFSAAERARHRRLVFHLCHAASHSFFLHIAQTQANRPAQAQCAVIDHHGVFHEAQPGFLALLDARAPGRAPQQLPFAIPAPGSTSGFHDLMLRCEPLGDRLLLTLWHAGPLDRLTGREREVVLCVAQGLSFKQAAKKIGVAPSTVANHLYRIYRKLGLSSRTELAALVHPAAVVP